MQIIINGETKEVPQDCSLTELVQLLELKPERLAIELNSEIARRQNWPTIKLSAGDSLEIVHFVGGGQFTLWN